MKKKLRYLKNLEDLDGIGSTQVKSIDSFFSNKKNIKIIQNLVNKLEIFNFELKKKMVNFQIKKLCLLGASKI